MGFVPIVSIVTVPFLFAFVFVKSAKMFWVNLEKQKASLQLATLDFADIVSFLCLPMAEETVFVYSEAFPLHALGGAVVAIVAFSSAILQTTLILGTMKTTLSRNW